MVVREIFLNILQDWTKCIPLNMVRKFNQMTTVRIKAMHSFNPCTHTHNTSQIVLYKDSMLQWPVFSGILNGLLSETAALGFIAVCCCSTSSN